MKENFMKRLTLLLLFTIISSSIVLAQERTFIGINVTSNIDYYTTITPELGLLLEKQATNHSGMEIGLNYRTYNRELAVGINNQSYYPLIIEKYLSIPILYKFYSKFINAGIGLTFDYSLGWTERNPAPSYSSYYNTEYDYYVGPVAKLSKEIHLGENFILEPEVKANVILIPIGRTYFGFGIVTKFDLRKD